MKRVETFLSWLSQNYFTFACIMYANSFTTLKFQLFPDLVWKERKHSSMTYIPCCRSAFFSLLVPCCASECVASSSWAETQSPFTYSAPDFHGKRTIAHADTSHVQTNVETEPTAFPSIRPALQSHHITTSMTQSSLWVLSYKNRKRGKQDYKIQPQGQIGLYEGILYFTFHF